VFAIGAPPRSQRPVPDFTHAHRQQRGYGRDTLRMKAATPYAKKNGAYDLNRCSSFRGGRGARSGPEDLDSGKGGDRHEYLLRLVRFAPATCTSRPQRRTIGERSRPGRRYLSHRGTRPGEIAGSSGRLERSSRSPLRTCRASGATPGCRRAKGLRGARFSYTSDQQHDRAPGLATRPAGL